MSIKKKGQFVIIAGPKDDHTKKRLFWSHTEGWTIKKEATRFQKEDSKYIQLPFEAKFLRVVKQ